MQTFRVSLPQGLPSGARISVGAAKIREAILDGKEVRLDDHPSGFEVTGDLELASVSAAQRVVIHRAVFTGHVDATDARFLRSVDLSKCVFERGLILSGAHVEGSLFLDNARMVRGNDLTAPGLRVDGVFQAMELSLERGDFYAPNSRIGDDLRLCGSRIRGNLNLSYTRIEGELFLRAAEKARPQTWIEGAATLLGCRIDGQVDAGGIRLDGWLVLESAQLGVSLLLSGDPGTGFRTVIRANDGVSISMQEAKVKGSLDLNGARLDGALNLLNAEVGGNLYCNGDSTTHQRTEIGKAGGRIGVQMTGAKVTGSVDFSGARLASSLILTQAVVSGDLICLGDAVTNQRTEIGGDAILLGTTVRGTVQWVGACIEGRFIAQGCELGSWLDATDLAVGGDLVLAAAHVKDRVQLSGAVVTGSLDFANARFDRELHIGVMHKFNWLEVDEDPLRATHLGGPVSLFRAELGGDWLAAKCELGWPDLARGRFRLAVASRRAESHMRFAVAELDRLSRSVDLLAELANKTVLTFSDGVGCLAKEVKSISEELIERLPRRYFLADLESAESLLKLARDAAGKLNQLATRLKDLKPDLPNKPALLGLLGMSVSKQVKTLGKLVKSCRKAVAKLTDARESLSKIQLLANQELKKSQSGIVRRRRSVVRRELMECHRTLRRSSLAPQERTARENRRTELEAELERLDEVPVLDLRQMVIRGRVRFSDQPGSSDASVIYGTIIAQAVHVNGDFRLHDTWVGGSVILEDALIEGGLNLKGTEVSGELNLRSARIRAQIFDPLEAEEVSPKVHGELRLDGAELQEVVLRLHASSCAKGGAVPTEVSLERARVGRLIVSGELPSGERPYFRLSGLQFDELDVGKLNDGSPSIDGGRWLARLRRSQFELFLAQMEEFDLAAYLRVEQWLRNQGKDKEADLVYLAMRRRELRLHPLTIWQRLWRSWDFQRRGVPTSPTAAAAAGRLNPAVVGQEPPMNLARWLGGFPLWSRRPMPLGWFRWGMNWLLLRSVGFGVQTRKPAAVLLLAFLLSWLCIFAVPESVERKRSTGLAALSRTTFVEQSMTWAQTAIMPDGSNSVVTIVNEVPVTNWVARFRKPTPAEIEQHQRDIEDLFRRDKFVFNEAGGRPEHWDRFDGLWLAFRVHMPLVELMTRDNYKPAESQVRIACLWDGRNIQHDQRRALFWLNYDTYAATMQILSYLLVPLIVASAAGLLKKR